MLYCLWFRIMVICSVVCIDSLGGLTSQKVTEFLAVLNIGSSSGDAVAVELLSRWVHNEEPADTCCDDIFGAACFQQNCTEAEAIETTTPSVRKRRKVSEHRSIPVSSSGDDASHSHSGIGVILQMDKILCPIHPVYLPIG